MVPRGTKLFRTYRTSKFTKQDKPNRRKGAFSNMKFQEDKKVFYQDGYKYQLTKTFHVKTSIHPPKAIFTKFITLKTNGELTVKWGYAHDGASGPTFDTKSTFRAVTMHDPIYQLIRLKKLDPKWRVVADEDFRRLMTEDLAWWEPEFRVTLWVRELKKFGGSAADPKNKKPILTAP